MSKINYQELNKDYGFRVRKEFVAVEYNILSGNKRILFRSQFVTCCFTEWDCCFDTYPITAQAILSTAIILN